jgi:hypothetical protein
MTRTRVEETVGIVGFAAVVGVAVVGVAVVGVAVVEVAAVAEVVVCTARFGPEAARRCTDLRGRFGDSFEEWIISADVVGVLLLGFGPIQWF